MRVVTSINIVLILILISPCSFANITQPQVPAKEEQKAEQPSKTVQELNREFSVAVMQGRQEKAKELISQGADVNTRLFRSMTILHMAAVNGNDQAVAFLLENGAVVDARRQNGCTPLHMAAGAGFRRRKRKPEMVKILVSNGADVNAQDKYSLTPLHYAVVAGNEEIVRLLLGRADIIVDSQDNSGRTPLHYTASVSSGAYAIHTEFPAAIAQLLLDSGADINARDAIGQTPLFYTFHEPDKNALRFLVQKGADLNCVDNRGYTPISFLDSQFVQNEIFSYLPVFKEYELAMKEVAAILRDSLESNYCVFVAPEGDDMNSGSLDSPFKTITAAMDVVGPGDSVIVRGGHYRCSRTIHMNKSGESGRPIRIVGYPGEMPVLDFSQTKGRAFFIEGAYWHIKNLRITGVEYGIALYGESSHHNVLEQLIVCKNRQGLRLISVARGAAHNIIINCDAHENCDFVSRGGGADGFSVGNRNGPGNVLIGNRAWNNSDDGYDCWNSAHPVRFEKCYAWRNGENIWDYPLFRGDSNGFKCAGEARHICIGCLAWGHDNNGWTSGNKAGVILRNCTAWSNSTNYEFGETGWPEEERTGGVFMNNLSYKGGTEDHYPPRAERQNNSWDSELNLTLTDDDFLSLDERKMSAPRNPDGSIPYNNFLKLAPDSAAIDAGIDVNMPYVSKAPDLGAFEYDSNENSDDYVKMLHQAVRDHDMKEIKRLLDDGEGINDKDWLGYTSLHWAVYFGYTDLVELLISKGADPNIQSDTGRYTLEIARSMAFPELEELLRKHGVKE